MMSRGQPRRGCSRNVAPSEPNRPVPNTSTANGPSLRAPTVGRWTTGTLAVCMFAGLCGHNRPGLPIAADFARGWSDDTSRYRGNTKPPGGMSPFLRVAAEAANGGERARREGATVRERAEARKRPTDSTKSISLAMIQQESNF